MGAVGLDPGSRERRTRTKRLRHPTQALDRRTNLRLAQSLAPLVEGLRANRREFPSVRPSGNDPSHGPPTMKLDFLDTLLPEYQYQLPIWILALEQSAC